MPAIQATRCIRQTALSFFAGKPRSNRDRIQLERCLPANWAVRCIRHNTALMWERCLPAIQATRCIRQTALSFIAGKRAPTDDHRPVGACGRHSDLPANQMTRSIRHTVYSFLANKFAPTGDAFPVGARLAREAGAAVYQADRVIVHRGQGGAPLRSLLRGSLIPVAASVLSKALVKARS